MYRPLHDKVYVERIPPETMRNGLLIPEKAQKKLHEGIVISIGPDVLDIKPGNHVFFSPYVDTEAPMDGKTVTIMTEADIIGYFPKLKKAG